jgi:uncharacterized protein YkwD
MAAFRVASASLALLCAAGILATSAAPAVPSSGLPQAHLAGFRQSLLAQMNRQRARHGLRPLRSSRKLAKAARWQSRDMVAHGYFDHERRGGPSFARRIKRSGYPSGARSWSAGENLGLGEGVTSPQAIVSGWMRSRPHRTELLRKGYRHVGIGLVSDSPFGGWGPGSAVTVTADFGSRHG